MQSADDGRMLLLSSNQSICDQFVSNSGGACYKREECIVTNLGGKRGNRIEISLLGTGQSSCRLVCKVWWVLKTVEGQSLRVQSWFSELCSLLWLYCMFHTYVSSFWMIVLLCHSLGKQQNKKMILHLEFWTKKGIFKEYFSSIIFSLAVAFLCFSSTVLSISWINSTYEQLHFIVFFC